VFSTKQVDKNNLTMKSNIAADLSIIRDIQCYKLEYYHRRTAQISQRNYS
jgi:hypothetical protein